MRINSQADLMEIREAYSKVLYFPESTKANIGMASCGIAAGARTSYQKAIKEFLGEDGVQICQTGCIGLCEEEPLVEILEKGKPRVIYKHVTEDKICDVIHDFMDGRFDKKLILGQMRDPRSVLEERVEKLKYSVIALAGELGEISDPIKKFLRKSEKFGLNEKDFKSLKGTITEEVIDVLIYILKMAVLLDIDLKEEYFKKMEQNASKFKEFKN